MTPLMRQYWEIKSQHPDKIVLFRMGDFFEMFHQDAETAAPLLSIALTVRNRKANDETKMCGVPHHSVATPIAKLLAAGYKIAICDQIEDPATAKGLVKRAVTRVLTPGMVYDPATLDQLAGHYLCSYDESTVSFLEPTTGEAFYYRAHDRTERERLWLLLQPRELVLTSNQRQSLDLPSGWAPHLSVFDEVDSGLESGAPESARRLTSYAVALQGGDLKCTVSKWQERFLNRTIALSATVLRHLEILETYRGERRGSLLYAIDRTKTAAGARLLRQWLQFPLTDQKDIEARLDQVADWSQRPDALKLARDVLAIVGDVERRVGKIANPGCSPRDLGALGQSLKSGFQLLPLCPLMETDLEILEVAREISERIERELVAEPPLSSRQGGLFQRGVFTELDELITLTEDAQTLLAQLEAREREASGIGSLKVRFNNVFGYYIEITKTHAGKVPARYQRKQTLANAERYTTEELSTLEAKILSAQSRRSDLEWQLFSRLREAVLESAHDLAHLARRWSELDVFTGLAWLALEYDYSRPTFSQEGRLHLEASRHPVVEQEVNAAFVPNRIELESGHCLLLTGPNMAGKSTLMRQVAVSAMLAQIGGFVPAKSAVLPIFKSLHTRIGASDFLHQGLSTFMVEMCEAAEILNKAGPDSLVILDEIGRGTSTYDGLSLAQAILEYLLQYKRPMIFFATHYHELVQLGAKFPQIHNAHMAIHEKGGEIRFLHTLMNGPANKSYGIHVARLAGLPKEVTTRAKALLTQHESGGALPSDQLTLSLNSEIEPQPSAEIENLLAQIREASVQKMTPLEALNQIAQWQRSLS